MHFQFFQPREILSRHIKHYWTMESAPIESSHSERVIPTGDVQLMFHFKTPFVARHPDNKVTQQSPSMISGLTNSYCDVSTQGETGVIAVTFHPVGACHFFSFPLSEIENQSINLADIFSKEIRQIEEQLNDQKTMPGKIRIIEDFLLKKLFSIPSHDRCLIQKGIEIIKTNRGQIHAFSLSDKLSVTNKNLERKFSQYIGKTTKQYIKLVRFQEILKDFSINKTMNLTEYAYRNGYFDQSHFIRDFKSYSGYTPKEFIIKYPDFSLNTDSC